ncbi:hypothetical protein H8356DRAFT_1325157 [Neocallimastix lanati (nom. inval.)]|nr:hypothetical protein H8356DRAFT_1325157 [Neocallimastix sp. JGI-2020a]
MSGVQFHLTTHYNPFDSLTLNRTSHRLHYDRASQFGVIPAYCKSSLVNVFACSSRVRIDFLIWRKVIVCGCGLPYPSSPNLVSVDAEMVWHGSTLLYPDTPAIKLTRDNNNNNSCSTMKIKKKFILFSIVIGILYILPFLFILIFKNDVMNVIHFLANSSKRVYYVNSVGLLGFETLLKDNTSFNIHIGAYFSEKAETLQQVYGGPITSFSYLNEYLGKPG